LSYDTVIFNYGNGAFKTGTLTLKNYKITNASKTGYKKLTFDVVFQRPSNYSKTEVDNMLDGYYNYDAGLGTAEYFTVVDYDTGECLENKNTQNVTVKSSSWKYSNTKKHNGTDGNWAKLSQTVTCSVTITYPKNYKNLCIVAGGTSSINNIFSDAFFDGKTTFLYADDLYSKSSTHKKVAHALRVK
jgi:hypothetical protein